MGRHKVADYTMADDAITRLENAHHMLSLQAAIVHLRGERGPVTAKELHAALLRHTTFDGLTLSSVKRACSRLAQASKAGDDTSYESLAARAVHSQQELETALAAKIDQAPADNNPWLVRRVNSEKRKDWMAHLHVFEPMRRPPRVTADRSSSPMRGPCPLYGSHIFESCPPGGSMCDCGARQ